MRALAGLFAVVLALGIVACGGAGTPPVQVAPTAAPPASVSPAGAPAASPAGTAAPGDQDDYDY